jgi:hypothetical protein
MACRKHLGGPTFLCYHDHMKSSTRDNTTTRRQRPPQPGELIGVRFQPEPLAAVDRWRRQQEDLPSRAEAIRRLVEQALTSTDTRPTKPEAQQKAAELAAREIDKMTDRDVPSEERVQRKRRLIKGPREFREIRSTRSKK